MKTLKKCMRKNQIVMMMSEKNKWKKENNFNKFQSKNKEKNCKSSWTVRLNLGEGKLVQEALKSKLDLKFLQKFRNKKLKLIIITTTKAE